MVTPGHEDGGYVTGKTENDLETQRAEFLEEAKALAAGRVTQDMDQDQKMDLLEGAMMELLDIQIMAPPVGRVGYKAAGGWPPPPPKGSGKGALSDFLKKPWLMGDDPRLPKMPQQPTLVDFFKYRFLLVGFAGNHLLQSAKLAMDKGCDEKVVLACLLHDISVDNLIRTDHGHWGAQMIEPYVAPEVAWAVKHHSALRFKPDPKYNYKYPEVYLKLFGEKYDPPQYVKDEWDYCAAHPWYDYAMQVVCNDLYAFDPNVNVSIEDFAGIIERNFKQPEEGLGFDRSPVAHMWRTIIWPNSFL